MILHCKITFIFTVIPKAVLKEESNMDRLLPGILILLLELNILNIFWNVKMKIH